MRTAKTLIRLGGCPGWCKSSLGAHSFYWFCHVAAHMLMVMIPLLAALNITANSTVVYIWAVTRQNQQCGCAPSKDSDQPGHPPSLSYPLSAQRRLWSDWTDAQADLSLRWAHTHFVGFVMSWLISVLLELRHFHRTVGTIKKLLPRTLVPLSPLYP